MKRIHDRYLLKQFVRIFLYSVVGFVIIYITIDIFEEIDNFIDHEAKMWDIARFYFYSIPYALSYIIPVSLLLATIFSMGILARRNELTAFIASGISLLRVAAPILILAALISLFSGYFNDVVVSKANRLQRNVKDVDIEGRIKNDPLNKENFRYLGENGYVYMARRYNHRSRMMYEVVVQHFADNTLTRRIDAKRAAWKNGHWEFFSGYDRTFAGKNEDVRAFDELEVSGLAETPEHFAKEEVAEEHMNSIELMAHIDKVRKSGGEVQQYLTDLYAKFAYPFAGSIFVLLGIAFSSGRRKQSIATGFGLTLLTSFIYYVLLKVGQSLGYNGLIPPLLAAQLGNIIFLAIAVGLVTKANQ